MEVVEADHDSSEEEVGLNLEVVEAGLDSSEEVGQETSEEKKVVSLFH